ncbi:hypothetical protein LSH36_625g01040 [Paralvinella palmiformis]|uniref:Uncharacterized protein n=1 Tax=Paralvinella palmiformis TaxID=53620 RepID=A0AAD9MUE9_9ANNE|nr:hypothetical protein LSH36_625g01040 [Paralvinella palmiformis]
MPNKNNKFQSVLADARSSQVVIHLLTLAMLYFRLTGPDWHLLGAKTHYLDFLNMWSMKDQFEQWSQDASSIFNAELASLFEQQQPHCVSFIADIQVDQATKHQAYGAKLYRGKDSEYCHM